MSDVAAAIERRIAQFLDSADHRDDWLKPAVRRWTFLPLYRGWVATIGIRPDGTIVRWNSEEDPENIHLQPGSFWQRLALWQGAKSFPELVSLQPQRPPHAVTCDYCRGTGEMPAPLQDAICQCGGSGWSIPGEVREPSAG